MDSTISGMIPLANVEKVDALIKELESLAEERGTPLRVMAAGYADGLVGVACAYDRLLADVDAAKRILGHPELHICMAAKARVEEAERERSLNEASSTRAEREACAKVADELADRRGGIATHIAASIRARK